jgi:hypothetical protein
MALIGGVHTTSTAATRLSTDSTPCDQLVLRLQISGTTCYWGGSAVGSTGTSAYGFMVGGTNPESYTIGPFSHGPVRPNEVYIASGAAAESINWFGHEF